MSKDKILIAGIGDTGERKCEVHVDEFSKMIAKGLVSSSDSFTVMCECVPGTLNCFKELTDAQKEVLQEKVLLELLNHSNEKKEALLDAPHNKMTDVDKIFASMSIEDIENDIISYGSMHTGD